MTDTDIDGAVVTNCPIEYIGSSFPTSGTTITNVGTGGSNNNGTAYQNDYTTCVPSNVKGWKLIGGADIITLPGGNGVVSDLSGVTAELLVYWNASTGTWDVLASAYDVSGAMGGGDHTQYFTIAINSANNCLYIYKACTGGSGYDEWNTPNGSITPGGWYFIQVSWALGSGPGATPIICIDNVSQALTHTSTGSGTWRELSNSPLVLGNYEYDTKTNVSTWQNACTWTSASIYVGSPPGYPWLITTGPRAGQHSTTQVFAWFYNGSYYDYDTPLYKWYYNGNYYDNPVYSDSYSYAPFNGTIALFRWHTVAFDLSALSVNYNASIWRAIGGDVNAGSATAVVSPTANVPLVGVGPPGVTGAVVPSAKVPIIDVSATPLTAIVGPLANVPLPDVWLPPADSAVVSPVLNVPLAGVGPPAANPAVVSPSANVPMIDVSTPDMTIVVKVRAIVPWMTTYAYRHHRTSQIQESVPRCSGLFAPERGRCGGVLTSRGSRNVGLLEPDMATDTYTPEAGH